VTIEAGQQLSHYRLIEKIGEGGMGVVWKAVDTRLDRDVAIKLLPAGHASDADRLRRFRREARALAALDHPAIVTIHSVAEADGIHFLVMGFVDGRPLDEAIPARGLDCTRLFELALQLTDALAAAHEKGIVHRDLKPQNVMVTATGRLKVLDFGIAKLAEAEPSGGGDATRTAALTGQGMAIGTPGYMSPEQIEGREVDLRTDIFSLGILLHRMATGSEPFTGATAPAKIASILRDTPPSVAKHRDDLPPELAEAILRCLAKQPDQRFATMRELHDALSEMAGRPATSSTPVRRSPPGEAEKSIAVLPFVNRSAGTEYDYFGDGLSEELINALSKIAGLKVTARSSAFRFRGEQADAREIGRRLDVGSILEGSVRIAGDRLRITAQLIDCESGYQSWSERYDGDLTDVFETQDEIARAIVSQLEVQLGGSGERPLVARGTENMEAYHLYLKGRHHRDKMTRDGLLAAIGLFEEAIRVAPGYGAAFAGLADTQILSAYWTGEDPSKAFARARSSAEKALALDPANAEAHSAMGTIHTFHDLDWAAADAMFRRALELNPNQAFIHYWYSMFLAITVRGEEAVAAARRSHELDPLSSIINGSCGQILYVCGKVDEAVAFLEQSVALDPNDYFLQHALGWAYRESGRHEQAIASGRKAVELSDGMAWIETVLALTCYRFGEREEAERIFAELVRRAETEFVWPTSFVFMHLVRGEIEEAARALERARKTRDPAFCWFNTLRRGSPSLELPSDPAIEAILQTAGIP
jgi:serine/threonine protein kinase/tetratricopeptide (TPR) repeat protein